jgi:asparagine synthase (glutamine-hydrolysing)
MCGIAGLWFGGRVGEPRLRHLGVAIGAAMAHRGPDADGVFVDGRKELLLVHRRLSILDLAPTGAQPMATKDGRFTLIFNGEIYNFNELRQRLIKDKCHFRGTSDTEVVLEGCASWGAEALVSQLNGMYTFALWDERERTLFLARDPIGIKPLFYGWCDDTLLFGSELKALCAVAGFKPEVNRSALGLFFKYNYIPAPHSIYQGIFKLPAGHYIRFRSSGVRETPVQSWTSRTFIAGEPRQYVDQYDAIDDLDSLLRDSIRRQMVSDVPIGAFLSGGVDSSVVVALMQRQSPRPVKTFSIAFEESEFNEADCASAVARHLGTDHTQTLVTSKEALALVPQLPRILDEPLADASAIPTYFVCKLARRDVTVSLSGDGGDELFMGYNHVVQAWNRTRRIESMPPVVRRLASRAFALAGPVHPKFRKYATVLQQKNVDDIVSAIASHWVRPADVVIGSGVAEPSVSLSQDSLEAITYWDIANWMAEDVLTKVDRTSMAVSLEARVPILDQRIVEFALGLPVSLKLRNGQRKWLLRQVLYRYVPSQLIDRPKQGFSVPLARWIRGPMRDWAEDLLSERTLNAEGFLRARPIRRMWREHLHGKRDWSERLWSVLMFQAWVAEWR